MCQSKRRPVYDVVSMYKQYCNFPDFTVFDLQEEMHPLLTNLVPNYLKLLGQGTSICKNQKEEFFHQYYFIYRLVKAGNFMVNYEKVFLRAITINCLSIVGLILVFFYRFFVRVKVI